jgi:transcriptional regulator with XRE-family HTH domain
MVESLGARIKRFRLERELTLQVVADELGLTPAAISHWESGRIIPKDKKLQDLAKSLGVTFAALKGANSVVDRARTPMAGISEILWDAKQRIAGLMGCAPEDVELDWRIK